MPITTRNIVPRVNNEGTLGTSSKRWSKLYVSEIDISGGSVSGGGISYTSISANTTAEKNKGYLINATSSDVTLTLPLSPESGDSIAVVDSHKMANINTITIGRNGSKIEGETEDLILDIAGSGFTIVYVDSTIGWKVVSEVGANSSVGLFEIDMEGALIPSENILSDPCFELDENGALIPK